MGGNYGGKYSAVIALNKAQSLEIHAGHILRKTHFSTTNHSAVFPPVHQTTEFRQTTVRVTVVDLSHLEP